jgi:uncharacterized GH25 family protein
MMTSEAERHPFLEVVMRLRAVALLASLVAFIPPARAHYNMLLPASPSVMRGEPVTLIYQWGHPFEHQLFDAPAPKGLVVLTPDGKKADLTGKLEKVALVAEKGKKVSGYRLRYTPAQRGDHVFVLETPPIWLEEDQEFVRDTVKVVLHVQAQKGWDAASRRDFEFVPLTRPYGLEPGMVFQARVQRAPEKSADAGLPRPLRGALVEVERYNAIAPKELPPDEQITRTAKTDPNGVVTATLTDAGWWCLTAARDGGKRERGGKAFPVRQRCTFWVHVAEKARAK